MVATCMVHIPAFPPLGSCYWIELQHSYTTNHCQVVGHGLHIQASWINGICGASNLHQCWFVLIDRYCRTVFLAVEGALNSAAVDAHPLNEHDGRSSHASRGLYVTLLSQALKSYASCPISSSQVTLNFLSESPCLPATLFFIIS
jgi:hypothetical protein